jgi:hypothetical protein
MNPILRSLLVFLGLSILVFLALRLAVYVTSLMLKLLLWTGVVVMFALAVNYLLLPRLGTKPLPLRSSVVRPLEEGGERILREQLPRVEKHIGPTVRKTVQRYVTDPLLEGTTGFHR